MKCATEPAVTSCDHHLSVCQSVSQSVSQSTDGPVDRPRSLLVADGFGCPRWCRDKMPLWLLKQAALPRIRSL